LSLLKDPHYFVDALVAMSDWFGFEPEKVENVIKLPSNIRKIVEVFKFAEQPFAGCKFAPTEFFSGSELKIIFLYVTLFLQY
jgi:hypothetical protein